MGTTPTMIWGFHPVAEAMRAGRRRLYAVFLAREKTDARVEPLVQMAERLGIGVQAMPAAKLTALVGHGRHQGIGARVSEYPLCTLEDILASAAADPMKPFILVLDQIVDPQNLGAIARTAHCAGIHGIVMPKNRSAPPSPAACKASAGALEHMAMAYVTNIANTLRGLKSRGVWIAGADHLADASVYETALTGPLAIVIGGEEKGIRPLVKKQCDFTLCIPQTGSIGSLNASAAAAIIIYEAFRQRRRRQ
jgi:23S rRNA (guanosine2251-2'-O)-methyltransferase